MLCAWVLAITRTDARQCRGSNDASCSLDALALRFPNRSLLALELQLNPTSGWGNFGLNLLVQAAFNSSMPFFPVITMQPNWRCNAAEYREKAKFKLVSTQQQGIIKEFSGRSHKFHRDIPYPVLHGVSDFDSPPWGVVWGTKNVAVCFYERSSMSELATMNAKRYDLVMTGSEWNTATLRAAGIPNVHTILQGVDTELFAPAVSAGVQVDKAFVLPPMIPSGRSTRLDWSNRFVVFSGGKLERRKGQDILIAAFRQFLAAYPEAGHVKGYPGVHPKQKHRILFKEWVARNGIGARHFHDMGETTHEQVAVVLKHVDTAVFTNRAEGGTNLVAMEAMASGLPVVISNNTGHVDIITATDAADTESDTTELRSHCYPLTHQRYLNQPGIEGWGESDVAEVLRLLEHIYTHPQEARIVGVNAARFIRERFTWNFAVQHLVETMSEQGTFEITQQPSQTTF